MSLVRFNLWYFALSLLISVPLVLIALYFQPGIILPEYQTRHTLDVTMLVPRFFSYLLWLGLFIGPACLVTIYDLWHKAGVKRFLTFLVASAALILIVSRFYPIASLHIQANVFGEMNLGWVESVVPSAALSAAFFLVILVGELFIIGLIYDLRNPESGDIKRLFLWIIVPLVLMSFTRVANRYMLIMLVPLSLYLAYVINGIYAERRKPFVLAALTLHILIFISVGFYSNYYMHLRGLA